MTEVGGGVLQEHGVGDAGGQMDQRIVHYIVITYLQHIGLTVRYVTNMVLRTSVSFAEDCPVTSVGPVIVDAHLRVSQAIKAWLCWRQRR